MKKHYTVLMLVTLFITLSACGRPDVDKNDAVPEQPVERDIAMAPTKNMDRTEWFAEKATEIGFDELTFLNCRFSERKVIKTERIAP